MFSRVDWNRLLSLLLSVLVQMKGYQVLPAILLFLVVHYGSAAFVESFTANPEIPPPNFNKVALFLWASSKNTIQEGGRGPVDPANPDSRNFMLLDKDSPAAETVLMKWDASNITQPRAVPQITFYYYFPTASGCSPTLLRMMWSNDTLRWHPLWNRTRAQSETNQWEGAAVAIPPAATAGPAAFKWVFVDATGVNACLSGSEIGLDDITFPTTAPSGDTMFLGRAPQAPVPSPAVCGVLQSICQGSATGTAAGGRRLKAV
jgi:hypothetical protein